MTNPSPKQVAALVDIMARYTTTATALAQAMVRNHEAVGRAVKSVAAASSAIAAATDRPTALVRYIPTHKGEA
ncbi:hypothetical protein [Rhodopseudomonas palustris]|uniref:hypothetical protein n=1 Tax=Rhodopseudomonas palustris TaxID=1076 RepID=UPI0021F26A17|nr:hypothetical protein [Rhodopseudomonas palustris]UYO55703.1 hypothetical protein KQX61_10000 [Rhodopseudomonas palustris]